MTPNDTDFIRHRAMLALSNNRAPGYHFAGYFLDLQCSRYERDGVVMEMDTAAHNANPDGTTNLAAVFFLADMALAGACRTFVDPSQRTATLKVHMHFLGGELRGRIRAETGSQGFSDRTALAEAICVGRVVSNGREVIQMSGTWVAPPTPDGRPLHPLPWEKTYRDPGLPLLAKAQLDPKEKAVLARVERALHEARHGEFMQRLWTPAVRHTPTGALGRLPIGLHVGNRVGHVQGGISLYAALSTATAAVPHHPLVTAVSAWYISPGQGKFLSARSRVLQKGRNVAVVRTELFGTGRKRVLEVVSNHAIARHRQHSS
jgi:acyl-coenzyme A thioesterase PaaI-like protein